MFREMRRFTQQIPESECIEILNNGSYGVLAVSGDDGYPYTVPLNFVYADGAVYFHCAKSGHKTDALEKEPKVSFCVVDKSEVAPSEITTHFCSVVIFGKAERLTEESEIRYAAELIGVKYSTDYREKYMRTIDKKINVMYCYRISIEHITGKEAFPLTKLRNL